MRRKGGEKRKRNARGQNGGRKEENEDKEDGKSRKIEEGKSRKIKRGKVGK